jgi:hypothetical protein
MVIPDTRPEKSMRQSICVTMPNENKMSNGYRCITIRRECVNAKTRIALGKPGSWMKSKRESAPLRVEGEISWSVRIQGCQTFAPSHG